MDEHCKLCVFTENVRVYFRSIYDLGREKHIHQPSKEEQEDKRVAIEPAATKVVPSRFIFMLNTLSRTRA